MRTKVCGITREADLRVAADAGADAVGVISEVSVDTPREVSPDRAAELVEAAPPFVSTVLVTMVPTTGRVVELAERVGPDAVQVHADLPPRRVLRLRTAVDADIIKTVDADDPASAGRYEGVVDSVDAEGAGGTGRTHDWERTREVVADLSVPAILAGGLTPDNVGRAAATVRPYGVDVATGVEREGGIKDHDAVRTFVENARGAGTGERSDTRSSDGPTGEDGEGSRGESSNGAGDGSRGESPDDTANRRGVQ